MECDEVRPCLGYSRSILPFTIRRAAVARRRRRRVGGEEGAEGRDDERRGADATRFPTERRKGAATKGA